MREKKITSNKEEASSSPGGRRKKVDKSQKLQGAR
jgi:hypothetical protein